MFIPKVNKSLQIRAKLHDIWVKVYMFGLGFEGFQKVATGFRQSGTTEWAEELVIVGCYYTTLKYYRGL